MSVAPPTDFTDLIDMKLHETRIVEGRVEDCLFTTVMRVPGGFVYRSFDKAAPMMAAVYVPFGGSQCMCPLVGANKGENK